MKMRNLIIGIVLAAVATSAQTYRIRVTDPDGNAATATIAASNRVAKVSALIDETMPDGGTNRAERLVAHIEKATLKAAHDHKVETVRAHAQAAAAAAVSAAEAE